MTTLLALLGVSFAVAVVLTPVMRVVSRRYGILDAPDGHRKLHSDATPLAGGMAVLGGMLVGLTAVVLSPASWRTFLIADSGFVISVMSAAVILAIVGLLDDRNGIRGRQKLIGQICAVTVIIASGMLIRNVQFMGWHMELGMLAIPFTYFWLLGAINALNLIDGVDGLASSVGIILSLAIAVVAVNNGQESCALLAVAIAGALTGFLLFNLPPASIFLGDTGSMLIGLVVGTLAIRCALKGPATLALSAPIAILAIPIFDASMAIIRRKLTGRSIYETDRGHLHHVLQRNGYSTRKTLVWISILCGITSTGALISISSKDERLALGSVLVVVATLVVTRIFGHSECMLLLRRSRSAVASILPRREQHLDPVPPIDGFQTRLQGKEEWEQLWSHMVERADEMNLHRLQLNVHLPAINVDYHASWSRKTQIEHSDLWIMDVPLYFNQRSIGRLKVGGPAGHDSVCLRVSEIATALKEFESEVDALLEIHRLDSKPLLPIRSAHRPPANSAVTKTG